MASVRKALYPVNAPTKTQTQQGKNLSKTIPKSRAQLRVVDVNRQTNEDTTNELIESKCILDKSKKTNEKTSEVKGAQRGEAIPKKELERTKQSKTKSQQSSKIRKEIDETKERLTEEKISVKIDEKTLDGEKIVKEAIDLGKDSICVGESTSEAYVQTEVTVNDDKPQLTVEDLVSVTVSAAYWRTLAIKFESELDDEMRNNFRLFARLAELRAEIETTERETEEIMDFVKDAIAMGQPPGTET